MATGRESRTSSVERSNTATSNLEEAMMELGFNHDGE